MRLEDLVVFIIAIVAIIASIVRNLYAYYYRKYYPEEWAAKQKETEENFKHFIESLEGSGYEVERPAQKIKKKQKHKPISVEKSRPVSYTPSPLILEEDESYKVTKVDHSHSYEIDTSTIYNVIDDEKVWQTQRQLGPSYAQRLIDHSNLQDAIIAKEIVDPPLGLRKGKC